GLDTGGKLFRNSCCWRSASFCWSASLACCSGLGPGEAQPINARRTVEIKIDLVSSFFIRGLEQDDNQTDQSGNFVPYMSGGSARPDYSTLVMYSSSVRSR